MSLLRHLLIALIYAAVAVAVALTLPYSVEGIGRWTSIALGAWSSSSAPYPRGLARSQRERTLNESLVVTAAEPARLPAPADPRREELRAIRDRSGSTGPTAMR